MSRPKTVEQKLQHLEYCLGRGAYEDAMCHAGDLFRYCYDRFKLMSGNCMDFEKAMSVYIKREDPHGVEGPSILDEVARRLD